jgi:hypothetical protein
MEGSGMLSFYCRGKRKTWEAGLDTWSARQARQEWAHRRCWTALAWSDVEGGGDSQLRWNLGQNDRTTKEISYAERITKWRAEMAASQRWVGGDGLPRCWGKAAKRRRKLWWLALIICGGQRVCGDRPAWRRRTPGSNKSGRDMTQGWLPCFSQTRARAWSVWSWPRPLSRWAGPNLLIQKFFYYSNSLKIVKYQTDPSWAPKLSKLCMSIEWGMMNNFPCGRKFKFETEFDLKNQETNCFWIWANFIGGWNMIQKIW